MDTADFIVCHFSAENPCKGAVIKIGKYKRAIS